MENQNSVAYVGKIGSVSEISGADNIELVTVGGWNAITKKGEYKVDDLVVVATTDAVIPKELSDGLAVTNYLRKGQRVRTVKLRGVYSECLIMSLGQVFKSNMSVDGFVEGQDMMGVLNITKYEPPAKVITLVPGDRKMKYHQNPNFHIYYKFPNQKNVPDMFNEEDMVVISRKLHGTNARYGIVRKKILSLWDRVKSFFGDRWAGFEYVYGSHNVEKGSDSQGFYSTDVWDDVAKKYDIRKKLWTHVKDTYEYLESGFIVYGEIYGAGIQKNYDYGLTDIKFAGFDVEVDGKYEGYPAEAAHFDVLDLPHVELLHWGRWNKEKQDSFVFNNNIKGTKVPHEGVIVKHESGDRRKVSKVINPDYLIYGEKNNVGDSH